MWKSQEQKHRSNCDHDDHEKAACTVARRKAGCTALSHFAASPSRIHWNSTWLLKAFKRVFMIKTDRWLAANPFFRHSLGHVTFYTDRHIFIRIAMDDIHAKCSVPHRNPQNMLISSPQHLSNSPFCTSLPLPPAFHGTSRPSKKEYKSFHSENQIKRKRK